MSFGAREYRLLIETQAKCEKLGLRLDFSFNHNALMLRPGHNDSLPVYDNGFCIFKGDLDSIANFLDGIEWAREYDTILGLKTNQRRDNAEKKFVRKNF